ncbi:Na(+)-translocating NADH-quinone reductase subunit F [Mesonia sp. HuA40]|uniref:Na(+)-translocating NADH-quinone reductase subunit F n=1 Tax=Mesonia sp. HuA40 TaxID=2602761 RepID=UPI0011C8D51C|nr:Na(+)-translocating NADH-quinone reductase subunit F [Mesonia sp. HuA40]TXK73646.1 Na(+)-translocating NADH-quinone reductase subunit F [Mesonia sp. HuA40]
MAFKKRTEKAISKLYIAFHKGELHPNCHCKCAVGNILNQADFWAGFSDNIGKGNLNYVGKVHQVLGRKYAGFTPQELLNIEVIFLKKLKYNSSRNGSYNQDDLFYGLEAVIKYLCQLDKQPNLLRIEELLDYQPKKTSLLV